MNEKKKKLFLLSPLALENGRGGEISSIELASGLNNIYDVSFMDTNIITDKILLSDETINIKLKGLKKRGRLRFLTLRILNKCFDFPFPRDIFRLYKILKEHHIVYTSYHNIKLSLLFIFYILLLPRTKFIIGYRKPLYSKRIFSLYNIKYRCSILLFSLIKKGLYHHVLSYHAKKFLEKFYGSSKIYHIVHGIDLDNYNGIKNEKEKDVLKFCYIGYLDDVHKGVGILLEGIKRFLKENKKPRVLFEFCGIGPLEPEVKKIEKQFPNIIKYYGYIDNLSIPKYYRKNDIFLFSSRREPFPRTIIEALASRLIIISSKTIGSIELLKGKKFGFFIKKLDPESIKEKINEVYNIWLNDPSKIEKLQEEARLFIVKNYSISHEIRMFKNFIDEIIKI